MIGKGKRTDCERAGEKLDKFLLGTLAGKTGKASYAAAGYGSTGENIKKNAVHAALGAQERKAELERHVLAVAAGEEEPGVGIGGQMSLFEEDNKIMEQAVMEAVEAQKRLSAIARMQWTEEVVLGNGEIVKKRPSFKDVINAIERLGKCQGWFVDKQEIDVRGAMPVVIHDDLTE